MPKSKNMYWRKSIILYLALMSSCQIVSAAEYKNTITSNTTLNDGDILNVDKTGIQSDKGDNFTVDVNGNITINVSNTNPNVGVLDGIYIDNGGILSITGEKGTLNINAIGNSDTYGIFSRSQQTPYFTVEPTVNINIQNNTDNTDLVGIYNWNSNSNFSGAVNIKISSDNDLTRAYAVQNVGGELIFNNDLNAESITTANQTNSFGYTAALSTEYASKTILNGKTTLKAEGNTESAIVMGVDSLFGNSATDRTAVTFNNNADITAINTDGEATAVYTQENADIFFRNNVNLTATGSTDENTIAIYNQGSGDNNTKNTGSRVDISKTAFSSDSTDAVTGKINGNIYTSEDSLTNINLTGADSFINGWIINNKTSTFQDTETDVALHNNAVWNNSGKSNVSNLILNEGKITQDENNTHTINIDNYSGTGSILLNGENTQGEFTSNSGNVTITTAAENSVINMGIADNSKDKINTLDSSKLKNSLNNIANKLYYTDYVKGKKNISGQVKIEEGLITPSAVGTIAFYEDSGQGYVIDTTNGNNNVTHTMAGMRDIASTAIIAWRQEDSTLSQRLGEIRNSKKSQGIWTRMSRGEFEYSGAYKNQYNFFQLGYDKLINDWHVGAAISHNDGETTYANGTGKNKSTSLSLYGTWLGDKGHYIDIVLKEGRLSNDYNIYLDAGYTHGDYDTWGTSLSAEYGRKIDFADNWYITPQAQLTFMRINGTDYTTNNGIYVSQDNLYSTVGRVGFELGKNLSDEQSIYLKASLLHDFAGDADTYLHLNGIENSYAQDIGNTWYELGLGTNFKMSDNSYFYADVVKTFGDDIKTPWQWNAGVRWDF